MLQNLTTSLQTVTMIQRRRKQTGTEHVSHIQYILSKLTNQKPLFTLFTENKIVINDYMKN